MVGNARAHLLTRRAAAGVLVAAALAASGCSPDGVESAPKMKGKKDEIQKEGPGLPITEKKKRGGARRP